MPQRTDDHMMEPLSDARIVDAWQRNAAAWTVAVRDGQIESRRLVTDRAIVDAVLARQPRSVLDLGCGEGWLARALSGHGMTVTGTDVVPRLIEQAQQAGGGDFRVLSYADIGAGVLDLRVDAVVCNFSLFGKESVEQLLAAIPALLQLGGTLLIQTLHPLAACGEQPYRDGWRQGSWAGFSADFTDPAPWYFRTMEGWTRLLSSCGLDRIELREPLHPKTGKPASAIFIASQSRPVHEPG